MAKRPITRRGIRLSRPNPEKYFTVMVVFSQKTFRWSMAKRTLVRIGIALVAGTFFSMVFSAYGFWATKKLMSFSALQKETQEQSLQLKESLGQADNLEAEVSLLQKQLQDILGAIDPKEGKEQPAQTDKPNALPPSPQDPKTGTVKSSPTPPANQPNGAPGTVQAKPKDPKINAIQSRLTVSHTRALDIRKRIGPIIKLWNHTPSIPPTAGYLSSGFGLRISPFSRANESGDGLWGMHRGWDISNIEGTPIQASANGDVVNAGWMDRYGWAVIIKHSDEFTTLYAHLSRIHVKAGQKVLRGDILGDMGRSGSATGVHLHYEVRRNGQPVNPKPYMRLQRQWLHALR